MTQEPEEEQPLDPELELVRRKMLRLLVVSIGIMGIGLFAVLGAIVYKLGSGFGTASGDGILESVIELPEGSSITQSHVTQNRLVLEVAGPDGQREFVIIDLEEGHILSRIKTQ